VTAPKDTLVIPGDAALFNVLIEAVPVPCTINNRTTGEMLATNRHIRAMLGMDTAEHSGPFYTPQFYANPAYRGELIAQLEDSGVVTDAEFNARRLDGTAVYCLASFQAATWQGMDVIVACLVDIADRKAAERALRESEEKFREIAENTNDVIWHLDSDLVVQDVYGGQRLLDWLGRSPLVGRPALSCFTPQTGARLVEAVRDRYRRETQGTRTGAARYEGELLSVRGERLWIEMMAYPHRDAAGRMVGLFGVMRDISERKRAETALRRSETLFRQMFDAAPIAMLLVEPETGFIFNANASAARFYGTDLAALRGRALADLASPDPDPDPDPDPGTAPSMLDQLRDCVSRGDSVVEQTHRLKSGEIRRVAAYVGQVDVPLNEGRTRSLLSVSLVDITDRARYARELENRNRALRDFTVAVSHDLQEPLRMVSGYLGLLERRLAERLKPEEHEFIGYAVDGAKRMHEMIQGLLTYSRLDTRAQPHQPVDLSDVVAAVLAMLRSQLLEHDTTVDVPHPLPTVRADRNQMVSLFQNLIGNAVKYRRRDSACEIAVTWQARGGWAEIAVRDNGIGIDPGQHDRVFGVFQRLRDIPDEDGTGMGLAICRRIVERHGGRIWVESERGRGATFRFTLPLSG
jgi:PAS domain S-box-containing protein